jgi:hypothetical protein
MTEGVTEDIYADVGRNDPCPCGSGRKFKKCCMRKARTRSEGSSSTRSVEDFVGPDTLPYEVLEMLRTIHGDKLYRLYYDMGHDAGPLRTRHASFGDLVAAIEEGSSRVPGREAYEFTRMRVDHPDIYLLLLRDEKGRSTLETDVVVLRPNEIDAEGTGRSVDHQGWRIWDVTHHTVERDEVDEVDFRALGIEWADTEFVRGRPVDELVGADDDEDAASEEE